MAKHVLFFTSTNLACNPRCLKEVRLLSSLGNNVTVVAFNLHNWTTEKETELKKELSKVEFHYLEITKVDFFQWLFSSALEKCSSFLTRVFKSNTFLQAMSVSKRSWVLLQWTKKWKGEADLIIAHNPPAFYPAAILAQKKNIPFALDIEDYHAGEESHDKQQTGITYVMRNVFPKAFYISYASPLIKKYTEDLVGKNNVPSIVINNIFSQNDFVYNPPNTSDKVEIVWFSQNIDFGRGVEIFISAIEALEDKINLTLIGNRRETFYQKYIQGRSNIKLISPLSNEALNKEAGAYDIGLAIEPGKDINNCIALSNKIWVYFQSGLYIIASDTPAQKGFIDEHKMHGVSIVLDNPSIQQSMEQIIKTIDVIRNKKQARFEAAKNYSWEIESGKLLSYWNKVLA